MWVVPIVLPIILLVVPLGLQVLESHLVKPLQPHKSEIPAGVAPVALEPVRPVIAPAPVELTAAPAGGARPPAPRLRAVPQSATAHAAAS